MNLHALVRTAINTVNPDILITLKRSAGYAVNDNYEQVPQYLTLQGYGQVQAMGSGDLRHAEFLNVQGVLKSVYLYGNWYGTVRTLEKGGDVLLFPDVPNGPVLTWKVVQVMENWPDWTKVLVCLQ